MKKIIYDFHTSFYLLAIQNFALHLTHVCILGTNNCGAMLHIAFKRRELFQDVLCCRDYTERAVASFNHQIKSEYYGGNRTFSIQGIALERFIEFTKG